MNSTMLLCTVMYHREFVSLGGTDCAIYLSNLLWNSDRWQDEDGWMPSNISEMQRITGLSARQQMTARIQLRGLGILQDKPTVGTIEPVVKINLQTLTERLSGGES